MDEINWTNKNLAQNTSFNHINAVTIWNPILDQRKGGSKRHRNFNALQMWLFKLRDSSRPRAPAPAGHWLMPANSSPFDKLVFSYHSPLPARGKNSRVATWQSPCQWSIQVQSMDWILSSMWVEMISNAFSYIHSSLFGDPDGLQTLADIPRGTRVRYPYLSYMLISIILHTYLNYPQDVSQVSYISCHLSQLSATCLCSG